MRVLSISEARLRGLKNWRADKEVGSLVHSQCGLSDDPRVASGPPNNRPPFFFHFFVMSLKNPTNGYTSNFKEIRHIDTEYGIKVTKFKSVKTGLTIVHADIDGKPMLLSKSLPLALTFSTFREKVFYHYFMETVPPAIRSIFYSIQFEEFFFIRVYLREPHYSRKLLISHQSIYCPSSLPIVLSIRMRILILLF